MKAHAALRRRLEWVEASWPAPEDAEPERPSYPVFLLDILLTIYECAPSAFDAGDLAIISPALAGNEAESERRIAAWLITKRGTNDGTDA